MNRLVPWVDPYNHSKLILKNNFLTSNNAKYSIIDGIPNFTKKIELNQEQVKNSFGYKWIRSDFGQTESDFYKKIRKKALEFMGLDENELQIFDNKIVLDVGIGSGSTSRLWGSRAKEFHGIDISEAIYKVKNIFEDFRLQPVLSQADLNYLPYSDNVFDVIVSAGVFHHTPDTKQAIKNVIRTLKKKGNLLFYIYKKKSPIREFSDDYIRSSISEMLHEQAWEEMKPFTDLGKSLQEQSIKIIIPTDIPILKIKKGTYDLHDFIYNNFFKCFYNSEYGYDDSTMINFDWYHPKFSWRHSEEEIKSWCKEMNLNIKFLKETYSGFACMVTKE